MATVQEFSKSIKQKYPQYANVDDNVLAQKMVEKYPEYKDRVQLGEQQPQQERGLLEKAAGFIGGEKLAKGLGSVLAGGAGEAAQQNILAQQQKSNQALMDAVQQGKMSADQASKLAAGTSQSFGQAIGEAGAATTADNMSSGEILGSAAQLGLTLAGAGGLGMAKSAGAGSLSQAAKGTGQLLKGSELARATGLGRQAVGGMLTGAGMGAAGQAEAGEDITAGGMLGGAAVGGALPFAGKAAAGAVNTGGKAFKKVASFFSGAPQEAIQRAFEKPNEIGRAIKSNITSAKDQETIVNNAKKALGKLKTERGLEYETALKNIPEANTQLPIDTFKQKVDDVLGKFDISRTEKGLDLENAVLPESSKREIKTVINKIDGWKDKSVIGLNKLRQIIDSNIKGTQDSAKTDKIFTSMKDNLRSLINESSPVIKEMNENYSKKSSIIKSIEKELSLGKKASPSTVLNKLTSMLNEKGEFKRKAVKSLGADGEQIFDDIVAGSLTEWLPQSLASKIIGGIASTGLAGAGMLASPTALLGAPLAMPRVVGKIATTAGKVAQKTKPLLEKLSPSLENKRLIRQGILSATQ